MKIAKYLSPKTLVIEEVEDPSIQSNEVKIKSIISGISHGSEMNVYRGVAPFFHKKFDRQTRLFIQSAQNDTWKYPVRSCDPGVWYMGYSNVGTVVEAGKEVNDIKPGDIVYSNGPHQSIVVKPASDVIKLPDSVNPEHGIFFTNLMTAYNGILDSPIKLGDTVVVSGLGVLGQTIVQMAKMSGAFQVIGIDLFDLRLQTALENGADYVFNPMTCKDIAYEVRKLTKNKGADLVIEVTGNQKALNEAIRIAAPDTTVTALGWYQGASTNLDLSEEFHHNRVKIRSSQTGAVDPAISHMWNRDRRQESCLELLSRLRLDNLITHKVSYDNISHAFQMVDENPKEVIQVALTY